MLRSLLIGFIGTLLLLLGGLVGIHLWCGDDLPSLAKVRSVESAVRTEIYDAHGRLLGTLSREDRRLISLRDVSPHLINAIISTEDRKFHRHWGVDPVGMVRATVNNLTSRDGRLQGGSTITQQLAWNLFLTHEQTLTRKLKELVMTIRLERSFSKEEILELYMNEIYFGDGAYGVETASYRFFGKSAAELTISEAALLAGIPKHPARFSPVRNPENAVARRNVVIKAMLDNNAIGLAQYQEARREPLEITIERRRTDTEWKAPYFVEAIRVRLMEEYGGDVTYEGGLRVHTTLDLDLQQEAERRLEQQLQLLETRNRYDYVIAATGTDSAAITPVNPTETRPARLQGAAMVLEPRSGRIRAMVGGRDFDESEFNRSTQALRQPGSAFKPFVYATALEHGKRINDVVLDERIVRFLPNGDRWEPGNFSRTYHGIVDLRDALAKSINIPAVLVMEEVGVNATRETARRMGIDSDLPEVLSLALGSGEVTLLELTAAYGPFANRGIYVAPYMISRIEDGTGRVLLTHQPETREALEEGVAFLVADMMHSVMDYGTGKSARRMGLKGWSAGKTGTTDDYTDAWFVGFNTQALCGVWVGFDVKRTIGNNMTGAACALPIWTGIVKAATGEVEPDTLAIPRGVVRVTVCPETGRTAEQWCPDARSELFLEGSAPQLPCPLHEGPVNRPRDG